MTVSTPHALEKPTDPSDEAQPQTPLGRTPERVEVLSEERLLDDFFVIDRAQVRFERYDGRMSAPVTRLVLERGDAVGVLLLDRESGDVILAQQFRYPAHLREGRGWLWEIVAGTQPAGRTSEEVARSEVLEEAGYRLDALQYAFSVYTTPGGSTERVHIYLAYVSADQRVAAGGGLAAEGEDIRLQQLPLEQALQMVADGRIADAKTVLALQYLALCRHKEHPHG